MFNIFHNSKKNSTLSILALWTLIAYQLFIKQWDANIFWWLNTLVNKKPFLGHTIAILNLSNFKVVLASLMGCFLLVYIFLIKDKYSKLEKLTRIILFLISVVILIFVCKVVITKLWGFNRPSPTAVFEDSFRVSTLFPNWHIRDISSSSFPSDNAVALFCWAGIVYYLSGPRLGLAAITFSIFFAMPRIFSGGHWSSDVFVGSAAIAAIILSAILSKPYREILESLSKKICSKAAKINI